MPTATLNAISGSGRIYKTTTNSNWGTATTGNGDSVDTTTFKVRAIRQNDSQYEVDRLFLAFDSSSIPANATITSTTLKLYLSSVNRVGMASYGFYIVSASQANPSSLAVTDYTTNIGGSDLGSGSKDPTTTGQYYSYTVSDTLVVLGGTSKVGLRSKRDLDNISPEDLADEETYGFQVVADANPPQLVVVYTLPSTGGNYSYFI